MEFFFVKLSRLILGGLATLSYRKIMEVYYVQIRREGDWSGKIREYKIFESSIERAIAFAKENYCYDETDYVNYACKD